VGARSVREFFDLPTWEQDEWLAYLRADIQGDFTAKNQPKQPRPGGLRRR